MSVDRSLIRNFSIIAHIDHGKSTLADRILSLTGAVEDRELKDQMLDNMSLERERGITIKLNAVQIKYRALDGKEYYFNLIDTPGHVDFSYEVSRSLAACEGAVLVVDATQGVEAQTLANLYLAVDNDLTVVPVINKIDLLSASPQMVIDELKNIGVDASDAPRISAKTGLNVRDVLEAIVKQVPPPTGEVDKPLQALIFDSFYDSYRGVVISIKVAQGSVKVNDQIRFMATGAVYEVSELGIRTPKEVKKEVLEAGEVGWLAATIKNIKDVHVGDTVTTVENSAEKPLAGYRKMTPMVYCGMFPVDNDDYNALGDALEKLSLNDASLYYAPDTSQALGFGFRCGFLGLLHMDVVQERLEREYGLNLICTAPSVVYHVHKKDGEVQYLDNPSKLPDPVYIDYIEEPYVLASIMTPKEFVGPLMELCQRKRGTYKSLDYVDETRMILTYDIPLSEVIFDFFDKLKSCSKGYASLDYEMQGYRKSNLIKLDILLNGEPIDALATITHRESAFNLGQRLTSRLKKIIPRQQFEVPVQAAIGGKVIARTNIKAVRKDVLAKCYGGDITRKKKLLEKQKEGKKRMKAIGTVEVPQAAFMAILSMEDDQ